MISTPSRLLLGKRKFSLLVSSNDMKRLMHQQLHKPKAAFDSWSLNIIYQLAWHERHERIDATRQRDPRLFLAFFSNGMWNGERLLANNLQSLSSSQSAWNKTSMVSVIWTFVFLKCCWWLMFYLHRAFPPYFLFGSVWFDWLGSARLLYLTCFVFCCIVFPDGFPNTSLMWLAEASDDDLVVYLSAINSILYLSLYIGDHNILYVSMCYLIHGFFLHIIVLLFLRRVATVLLTDQYLTACRLYRLWKEIW